MKTLRLAGLRRLESNLFHSITVDGKKGFLVMFGYVKEVMLSMKCSNFICISGIVTWVFCWY